MTPKERAAMQLALEVMEVWSDVMSARKGPAAITALREVLAEQAEQEPVYISEHCFRNGCACHYSTEVDGVPVTVYAAPVRTKDLTDDEIYTLYSEPCSDREMVEFARAVIAADREKNK